MRNRTLGIVAFATLTLICVPSSASAHPASKTVAGHLEEDSVAVTAAQERRFERNTRAATASDADAAAAAVAGDASEVGQWGPVLDWPVVGIHMALLSNGKVLAYDSVGDKLAVPDHDSTRATVWDPATGVHASAMLTGFNIWCSGLAHLMDGTLFTAGGNKNADFDGIRNTYTFNQDDNTWIRDTDMASERWYPSVTPLRDGEMLITEGYDGPDTPEVRELDGDFRQLTGAVRDLPLYPWMDVAPDGRAFYSGPTKPMRSLNPAGTGSWTGHGERDGVGRTYGGHTFYDIGKILVAGGGPSSPTATVIDLNGATPQTSPTGSMAYGRRQHNLTVLADGSVLATGGLSSGEPLVDLDAGVYPAELWDPDTGQWSTLAAMQVTRQYHSTALLLPDGRVLSAGGGICGTCSQVGYLEKNAEIFTPPYLFMDDGSGQLAPRPQITSAPGVVNYNEPFSISTPAASTISKVAMVRLGAVTHSVNMEQRYVPLTYTVDGDGLDATAPLNPNIAPPGVYMLFVIGANGVPSVAEMVRIEPGSGGVAAPTITGTDPASPSKDNSPDVEGTGAAAGSTVKVYGDPGCSGPVLGSGSASAFNGTAGVTAAVPSDQTTQLRVTATDAQGSASACSAPFPYTEDSTLPDTLITQAPPATTTTRTVTFEYTSTEPGSTFRCRLDSDVGFTPCTSPDQRTVGLGRHVFRVRAIDPANNFDSTPAKHVFKVVN
jgi:Domain of unknown function (DUF1929)